MDTNNDYEAWLINEYGRSMPTERVIDKPTFLKMLKEIRDELPSYDGRTARVNDLIAATERLDVGSFSSRMTFELVLKSNGFSLDNVPHADKPSVSDFLLNAGETMRQEYRKRFEQTHR